MKRVLIANIFGIGDVLFTTPIVSNLKAAYPGVEISYLCNARVEDLIKNNPGIDNTFVYEKDRVVTEWRESRLKGIKTVFGLFDKIKKDRFDMVFDFTLSREFGFLFFMAGIKKRVGFNYKKRGFFLTDKINIEGFDRKHVVQYYLDLLRKIDIPVSHEEMKLIPGKIALEWAAKFLEENNSNHTPVVAIIPGGGASWGRMSYRKRWSTENFAKVAGALSAKGCFILAGGDNTERALCAKVMGKVKGACSIVTDLPIELYVALLSRCDLVLCNDGGPLHIAASMGVKTVSIFGPVDDKVYGPYPPDKRHRVVTASDVECRPCYRRFKVPECHNDSKCLRNIHVDEVKKACEDLLGIKRKAIEGPEGRQIREREQGAGGDR